MNPSNNTDWNTPPNGDFARYVERLSAKAALAARTATGAGHDLDAGMSQQAPGLQPTAAQRRESAGGTAPVRNDGAAPPLSPATLKVLGVVSALVFFGLWSAGVPFFVLVVLFFLGVWAVQKLKGFKLAPGVAKWQRVLDEAARKQQELQRKQGK